MKEITIIILFIFVSNISKSQKTVDHISFLIEGKCSDALTHINTQVENDSISVKFFLDNYKIIDNPIQQIDKKDYKFIYDFFMLEGNKDIWCKKKNFNDFPLLDKPKD